MNVWNLQMLLSLFSSALELDGRNWFLNKLKHKSSGKKFKYNGLLNYIFVILSLLFYDVLVCQILKPLNPPLQMLQEEISAARAGGLDRYTHMISVHAFLHWFHMCRLHIFCFSKEGSNSFVSVTVTNVNCVLSV